MKITPYYKHFNWRLTQHFGIKIDREFYTLLCNRCRNKDSRVKFIKKDKYKNKVILKTNIKDNEVYLVYNKERCVLHTCMTKDMVAKI